MDIGHITDHSTVRDACDFVHRTDSETLAEMLTLVQIPAPPFGEEERAGYVADRFSGMGLHDVARDEAGNVFAHLGEGSGAPVIFSAHLDTVFPIDTDLTVRHVGDRILAPGIADNVRGVAALLTIARAIVESGVRCARPIVMLATVGEEGAGDLRGVKHVFRPGSPWRSAEAFIALDGTGMRRIVNRSIGSRRFHCRLSGPGGHSWADFGIVNPVHAVAHAAHLMTEIPLPRQPRTALTVARIGGGTSINAISSDAWIDIDLRSEAAGAIAEIEARMRDAIAMAAEDTNARRRRGSPALQSDIRTIGDRPTGETSAQSQIIRIARAVTRHFGEQPDLVASSTDANIPMSIGIPAITLGAGGDSGGTHTTEEWYSNENGPQGIERALLILIASAGLAQD